MYRWVVSDFFEPPPPREEEERPVRPPWAGPPRGVVPAVVPVEGVMARNDSAAIFLNAFHVYPAGFAVDIFVVAREGSELDPFFHRPDRRARTEGQIAPGLLRLGFSFADGSKVASTSVDPRATGEDGAPASPVMRPRGGRGQEDEWSQTFWVWPLPPPGPMEFVSEWPAAGLPLTRTELDAAAIIAAAPRAQVAFVE
jgi:hypothetical protein